MLFDERVGMVILNYNDPHTTLGLLSEVRKYNSLDEIVIVDNGSTDNSMELLSKAANGKVTLLVRDSNDGYAAGNNHGLKYLCQKSECSFSIVANPDVHISEGALIACIAFLRNHESYIATSPVPCDKQGKTQGDFYWEPPTYAQALCSCLYIGRRLMKKDLIVPAEAQEYVSVGALPGSLTVFDSSKIQSIGFYDEGTFLYYEEHTLGMRCANSGFKMALLINEEYIHDHGVSVRKAFSKASAVRKSYESMIYFLVAYRNIGSLRKFLVVALSRLSVAEFEILGMLEKLRKSFRCSRAGKERFAE